MAELLKPRRGSSPEAATVTGWEGLLGRQTGMNTRATIGWAGQKCGVRWSLVDTRTSGEIGLGPTLMASF